MKTLGIVILVCVTTLAIATERTWSNHLLEKKRLDIQQQQLSLDILKYINAQNERMERELRNPAPPRPSIEIRPSFTPEKLSFPRSRVQDSGRNGPLPETAQRQPRPQRFLPSNAVCLPAGNFLGKRNTTLSESAILAATRSILCGAMTIPRRQCCSRRARKRKRHRRAKDWPQLGR